MHMKTQTHQVSLSNFSHWFLSKIWWSLKYFSLGSPASDRGGRPHEYCLNELLLFLFIYVVRYLRVSHFSVFPCSCLTLLHFCLNVVFLKLRSCLLIVLLNVVIQIGASVETFIEGLMEPGHYFLLRVGEQKNSIQRYFIIIDKRQFPARPISHWQLLMSLSKHTSSSVWATMIPLQLLHIHPNHSVQHWFGKCQRKSQSQGTPSQIEVKLVSSVRHHTEFKTTMVYHGLYPAKTSCLNCGQPGYRFSFCTFSELKKRLNHTCGDVVSIDVVDNVDIRSEVNEPSTSHVVRLDSPVRPLLVLVLC